MQKLKRLIGKLAIPVLSLTISSCGDTQYDIDAMKTKIAQARLEASRQLAERLAKDPNLLHTSDVHLFLGKELIEKGLKLLEGFEMPLPNRPDVKIAIHSIKLAMSAGTPAVDIQLVATKGQLKLDIVGQASFLPHPLKPAQLEVSHGTGSVDLFPFGSLKGKAVVKGLPEFKITQQEPLRFEIVIEHLAPRVTWWVWSLDLKGFLSDFVELKINEALNANLPPLEIPFHNFFQIAQPEQVRDILVFDDAYTARLTTPPLSWGTTFNLENAIVLPHGIHLLGSFANTGATQ